MIGFELKKILRRTGCRVALVVYLSVILLACFNAVNNDVEVAYVNSQGNTETGYAAARKLRSAKKEWAGVLDQERLANVLEENQKILATPEAQSDDFQQNDIAYSWQQGIQDILWLMNYSYAKDFSTLDSYTANSVTEDMLPEFYTNRVKLLSEWLENSSEAAVRFSQQEKDFLLSQYEALETPMQYDYFQGWEQALYQSPMVIMASVIILCYIVSGVFSAEFRWKTDAVYFSSWNGRTKGTSAKIRAALILVTVIYWAGILAYSAFVFGYLGTDGGNCPIQLCLWKCLYNLSFQQLYALAVVGGYIGTLFFALLTMWISARTRSSVFAVTIPFIGILLPSILENIDAVALEKVIGLLPDRLLQISQVIRYFDLYSFGDTVIAGCNITPWLYGAACVLLIPALYLEYRRKRVI